MLNNAIKSTELVFEFKMNLDARESGWNFHITLFKYFVH